MSTQTIETGVSEFSHINLNEIDPSFQAIDEGFYTIQVNKLTAKVVTPKSGKNAGRQVLVLNGSYTLVNDDQYAGCKFWKSFWASNPVDLKDLRRQQDATGVVQVEGQSLEEYAATFETLNPPAELRIYIGKEADYRNPEQTVNVLKFAQAQPVSA